MPIDEEEQLAIGAIKASSEERRKIAKYSCNYKCDTCGMSLGEIAKQFMLEPTDDLQKQQLKVIASSDPQVPDKGEQLAEDEVTAPNETPYEAQAEQKHLSEEEIQEKSLKELTDYATEQCELEKSIELEIMKLEH